MVVVLGSNSNPWLDSITTEKNATMSDRVLLANVAPDSSQRSASLIVLFLILQLIGLFGSIVTLLTARLGSPIKRYSTWYNFMGSWVVSGISYTLLLFTGQIDLSGDDKNVPLALCVLQSSVIYAAPPLSAAATLGLVVQVSFSVHSMLFKRPVKAQQLLTKMVLVLPYLLFLGICAEALAFGLTQPASIRVTGSGMYCNSGLTLPGRISAGIVAAVLIPTVIIESRSIITENRTNSLNFFAVFTIVSLYKYRTIFKSLGPSTRVDVSSMMLRIVLFSIFGVFALGLSLFFFFTIHHGAALNIVIAFIPVAAVFVFGTQKDLLQVWMFWKWNWRKRENSDGLVRLRTNSESIVVSSIYEKELPPLPSSPQ